MYIYVSNESSWDVNVYFDDLTVSHTYNGIIQTEDYYPFGLAHNQAPDRQYNNKYLYNGKELQDELGLGWYDYQARYYDPVLGRFNSVDPAADLMRRFSTYSYAFDNPIRFVDPDGMMPGNPLIPSVSGSIILNAIIWVKNTIERTMNEKNLSEPEKNVVRSNPIAGLKSRNNKSIAEAFARNSGLPTDPMDPFHNDEADALRHTLFSALNTQTLGKKFAKEIGEAHEKGLNNNPPEERDMDNFNNEIGIEIGLNNPNASPKELTEIILNEIKNGNLKVLEKNNITKEEFNNIKNNVKTLYDDGKTDDEVLYGEGN